MQKAIDSLISAYISYNKINKDPQELNKYLLMYAKKSEEMIIYEDIHEELQKREVFHIFQKLPKTDINYKYAKFLLLVQKSENFKVYIKSLALGIEVPVHKHPMYKTIYEWGRIYMALKKFKSFKSEYHLKFFQRVKEILIEYENEIIISGTDPIVFFSRVYPIFLKLDLLNELNSNFDVNLLFLDPFKSLEINVDDELNSNIKKFIRGQESCWEFSCIQEDCIEDIKSIALYLKANREFRNWFDRSKSLNNKCNISGNVCPYNYLNKKKAQFYTGKFFEDDLEIPLNECQRISILKFLYQDLEYCSCKKTCEGFEENLDVLDINGNICYQLKILLDCTMIHLIPLLNYLNLMLLFLKNTFLFFRSDFIQCMFSLLRDLRISKNSFILVLDSSIDKAFTKNIFKNRLDIALLDSKDQWNYFTLFFKMDYPINILMSKEDNIILSKIFKHLWRIKKVENLLITIRMKTLCRNRRIRVIVYLDIIFKINFYLFYEVIEKEYQRIFIESGTNQIGLNPLVIINTQFRVFISTICKKIFFDKEIKAIFIKFLDSLEFMCKDVARDGRWNDEYVCSCLKEFLQNMQIEEGFLLKDYLQTIAI